jgi:hypothetical protein
MEYSDTKFLRMLKNYGISRIINSLDLRLSLIAAVVFAFVCWELELSKAMILDISIIFVTVSAAMLAVIIAGLAIVVSVSDDKFVKLLKDNNVYDNILFVFWYSAIIAGLSIISTTASYVSVRVPCFHYLSQYCNYSNNIYAISIGISAFFTFYALLSVIMLVGTTMRWGLYRGVIIQLGYDKLK